ncbi:hypothetical protein DFS33DRAFT_1316616 [Desarmillaria ectypa]|nr:hypothetical protein DFS33DRAFT_1316616 [Desarmillaria ectypa]
MEPSKSTLGRLVTPDRYLLAPWGAKTLYEPPDDYIRDIIGPVLKKADLATGVEQYSIIQVKDRVQLLASYDIDDVTARKMGPWYSSIVMLSA